MSGRGHAAPDLSALPAVDGVLSEPRVAALVERCDREHLAELSRQAIDAQRQRLLSGDAAGERDELLDAIVDDIQQRLSDLLAPRLKPVINATGILLHTNLGRAPLAAAAIEQMVATASSYCDIELDLESGERGHRHHVVEDLLCRLTGAEAAAVVNNNAAAVLLTLNALAMEREIVVSRGQLVEIGGSFRLPDMMQRSGATMVEVGTTNRTHLADYEAALTERTGLILSVHPSNYRVMGFTKQVELEELVALGRQHDVPVVEDLGAGALVDLTDWGLPAEPLVADSVATGADVVTFSGDKVLGGPQAGLLVGRREIIDKIRSNPWMRALRCDKLTYAALEATLRLFLHRESLPEHLPALRRLTTSPDQLRGRAAVVLTQLEPLTSSGWTVDVVDSVAHAGSGALPLEEIASVALKIAPHGLSVDALARRLRMGTPAVMGYVRDDCLLLDLRTVADDETASLTAALLAVATD